MRLTKDVLYYCDFE